MEGLFMYVDSLAPFQTHVGYGSPGLHGRLGYEDKPVSVHRQHYPHALSAHPPARLRFALGGHYRRFFSYAAINDDVAPGRSHADFFVRADGRLVGAAPFVGAGEPPRALFADVSGAQELELL